MTPTTPETALAAALAEYRANPLDLNDRPESWAALADLLTAADEASADLDRLRAVERAARESLRLWGQEGMAAAADALEAALTDRAAEEHPVERHGEMLVCTSCGAAEPVDDRAAEEGR